MQHARAATSVVLDVLERVGLPRRGGRPLPAPVQRRPAAAHRHRPRARAAAEADRRRRAGLGARRLDPVAGAEPARRAEAGVRPHLSLRRPRPRRRRLHLRPGRRDVPRQDRRARPVGRSLRAGRCTRTRWRCSRRTPSRCRAASSSAIVLTGDVPSPIDPPVAAAASARAARSRSRSAPRSSRCSRARRRPRAHRRLPLRGHAAAGRAVAGHPHAVASSRARRQAAARPARADAGRDLALRRRLPAALGRPACRRSCSGRRTSRRASASSAGASGSRSAATRRSSSTCAAATSRRASSTAWTRDGEDAHDTLTWAAGEQWCNGRIGTWGRSYGGLVQWQLAHLGHPNLECIAPQVIHDDYFWDGYWTGGAFQLALTLGAAALWTSAISLITGPSAGDARPERPRLPPPAADRARRGRRSGARSTTGAPGGSTRRTTSTGSSSGTGPRR